MKKLVLALALSLSFAGVSVAEIAPVPSAREIASALRLNEAQYLKVKKLDAERREELKRANANVEEINKKFYEALKSDLTSEQQEAYQAFLNKTAVKQQALGN